MKRSILLAAIFAVICFVNAGAQYEPPDECLIMVCPNDYSVLDNKGSVNPDSVMIDTCALGMEFNFGEFLNNIEEDKLYAKKGFYLELKTNCYPFDSLIKDGEYQIVENIRYPFLKQSFENIQTVYGNIYFRNVNINNQNDSIRFKYPFLEVFFDELRNVDSINKALKSIVELSDTVLFGGHRLAIDQPLSVKETNNNEIFITPNPTTDELHINLPNGTQSMIFIYSESGEKAKEMLYSEKINISDLPTGIYFIQIGNYRNKFNKK